MGKNKNKKGLKGKRKTDFWNEFAMEVGNIENEQRESFVQNIMQRPEGVTADKEKFIHGLQGGSHKVLPPNKKEHFINKIAPKED